MAVGLDVVAAAAGGHHVVPGVPAAPAARDDVVDTGRGGAAVHAAPSVPGEQGPAGQRDGPPVGDAHEPLQADDAGGRYGTGGTVHEGAGLLEANGLVLEDEDERAAEWYDAERLVRRVENQDMRHVDASLYAGGAWLAPGRSDLSLPSCLVGAPPRAGNGPEGFSSRALPPVCRDAPDQALRGACRRDRARCAIGHRPPAHTAATALTGWVPYLIHIPG